MQLNDAVPERRNLIVFCMATIVFFIGGGDACGDVKLPFGSIVLTNKTGLIFLYWSIFFYLILRYWSVFKSTPYDPDSGDNFSKKKNYKVAIQEAIIKSCHPSKLKIPPTWYFGHNTTELDFSAAADKIGFTTDQAIEEIIISRNCIEPNEAYCLVLEVKKHNSSTQKVKSEKIGLLSLKYAPVFFLTLLKSIFSDKYLFDWVFPWLILLVTLLTIVGASFAFDYSLCPPAPLPPGKS
ncbi:hypothetical protein [Alteromonas australica]|uniref:Uncharacterized protein n=1 Tax=Alteromonas australica TaxID=589873 RepID=A0A075P6W8_9ALTE|nr:hypothetical protein [Alteromonas australica]AIF99037.1 hypothetical protein EP13_10280 [Alteromonas australica]